MSFDEAGTQQQQDFSTTSLPEIPDLSGMLDEKPEPWDNGWYGTATFVPSHQFTKDGVVTTFESTDTPSQAGDSRNISARLTIKRKSDGRAMNTVFRVNYRTIDFTAESIAAVLAHKEAQKAAKAAGTDAPEWGSLFRTFSALTQIGTLQRIAGVRQFQRTSSGGLDITPLFGKSAFVRLTDDDRKPQYKKVAEVSDAAPKRANVL